METVCLIGRPNTGKSTLFNRLIKEKKAIIDDIPGITRDRLYGVVNYEDKRFHLIDTGGIDLSDDAFNENIKIQAEIAMEESDVIVFVIDGKTDLTSNDHKVAEMLLKQNKKVIVAVNKLDDVKHDNNIYNFYELGFDIYMPVSGEHNRGIKELLDEITKEFKPYTKEIKGENISFSIIGRPNVGKSSLVNALLNEDRLVVSNIAGTTRDAVDTTFMYEKESYTVIDTAGMRKRGKIFEQIEKYSLIRTLKAIDRSDVCVLVINAEEGIIEQDKHIASYALEAGVGIVLVINKWDLIKNKDEEMKRWKKEIESNFKFMPYAPVVFLSSLTKARIHTLMPEIIKSYTNSIREVKTSVLNNVIRDAYALNPSPSYKGKRLKIYFVNQEDINPPTFVFSVNNKRLLHFSYKRYLENKLREAFDFEGTPIVLKFKNRREDDE